MLLNERGQEVYGTYIVSLKKNSDLGEMGHFGPEMAHPHNFGSTLRIFFFAQ